MSLPNTLIRLWVARIASKLAICGAMTYDLWQLNQIRGRDGALKKGISSNETKRTLRQQNGKAKAESVTGNSTVEDVFIGGLVDAGSCRRSASKRWSLLPRRHEEGLSTRICLPIVRSETRRSFFTPPAWRQPTAAVAVREYVSPGEQHTSPSAITKEAYKELVNTYDSPFDLGDKPTHAPSPHYPLAPRLVIPPEKEDNPPYAPRTILPPEDEEHELALRRLYGLLRHDYGHISLSKLWSTYQSLPQPRLRYIPDSRLRHLFTHLSWTPHKDTSDAMPRYFSLLDECLGEQIPVTTPEWNTAISFAGRWLRRITSREVKAAVETWMRMESHGVQANPVTFNILFDVAVKAGRFALADTIYTELKQRGMELNRYFRTSMIYYAGIRCDGDGVRQAFRDLVNAGEIVDTAIMNCVILSLVRAGEPAAAENVFAKMKRLFEENLGTAGPRDWRAQRKLGVLLNRTAKNLRSEREAHESSFFGSSIPFGADSRREEVQKASAIAPNERTYRILIRHHAYTSGELDRIRILLKEMKGRGLRVHGSIYVHVFRGFGLHGGFSYTAWSRAALEELWGEFVAAAAATGTHARRKKDGEGWGQGTGEEPEGQEEGDEPEQADEDRAPCFTRGLATAAVRAFYKCAGRRRMLEVWSEVQEYWESAERSTREEVEDVVQRLCREDSVFVA